MRHGLVLGALLLAAAPVAAQDGLSCAEQADLVGAAVEARAEGEDYTAVKVTLGEALPDETAQVLADWIFSLPEAQLTPAVAVALEEQCAALATQ